VRQPSAIISDLRALTDELEEALNAAPAAPRARHSRGSRKKPDLQVTDLQRAKAQRLLRERGLIT
jgi:hypothetical protein